MHAYLQSAQAWITQCYLQTTPCLSFLRKRSLDGATTTEAADIQFQLITHISTRRHERLSWPGWLTYSGWFTYISGHPSATGRAQDREVRRPKDRRYIVVPRDQPVNIKRISSQTVSIFCYTCFDLIGTRIICLTLIIDEIRIRDGRIMICFVCVNSKSTKSGTWTNRTTKNRLRLPTLQWQHQTRM